MIEKAQPLAGSQPAFINKSYAGQARSYLPFLLVALSLVLNLYGLAADSFWGDEIFTAIYAGRSPAEVLQWTAGDIHPPLYYLIAGAFTRLLNSPDAAGQPNQVSDWLWRFPSALAGVLAVAVTYRLALSLLKRTVPPGHQPPASTAFAAALLLCLAPVAVKYGQEARMHALFMFLAALSTWLFFRAMARPRRLLLWMGFALTTAASLYTMYFGFLILATQTMLLLLIILREDLLPANRQHSTRNPQFVSRFNFLSPRFSLHASRLIGFSAAAGLTFLLYLPWWPVLFGILRKRAAVGAIEGGVGSPSVFISGVIQALGPAPAPVAWGFLSLFGLGLLFLARRDWPIAVFAALWLTLPVLLPIFLGDPRALQFRYAFILPVYLIVAAYGVRRISQLKFSWGSDSSAFLLFSNPANLFTYFLWLLATLSFIATLGVYNQTKPDWRRAAAYLDQQTAPADIILIGPLWDEGRFIGYYYRGQARLLTPAAFVANIEGYAAELRAGGGRLWAVNRFMPAETPGVKNVPFYGVHLSEPQLTVYEPDLLAGAALDLARQAIEAAYPWAAEADAQGVINPDPRTAQAAALRAWGDALVAAGRPQEALTPYQRAVDIFPGWPGGLIALAETQEAVGDFKAAVEAYRQAVAFNLKWQGPPAEKAAALAEAGQWSAALKEYQRIIKGE